MLPDIRLSKAQLSKIIQSGQFLGALLCKFDGLLIKVGVPLNKAFFASLATMASVFPIDVTI